MALCKRFCRYGLTLWEKSANPAVMNNVSRSLGGYRKPQNWGNKQIEVFKDADHRFELRQCDGARLSKKKQVRNYIALTFILTVIPSKYRANSLKNRSADFLQKSA